MNKIVVVNDKTEYIKLSKNIEFSIETFDSFFSITNIKIEINKEEDIYFFINSSDKKYKINIDINQNLNSNIYIFENVVNSKIQYSFTLSENAILNIYHFNKNMNSKQMIESNLIGTNTIFNYFIKKICQSKETSDFYIHHCGSDSTSNIKGDITSIENSSFSAQLSIFVEEDCNNAKTIQGINVFKNGDCKTELKPNLYIDNGTTTINHNNDIKNIYEFVEYDFMINDIEDEKLKQEIINFIKEKGD